MPRNYLSNEEIAELEANPNVEKVSRANIVFTKEFKERVINLYNQGYSPSKIFELNGISNQVVGRRRRMTFFHRIRELSVSLKGLTEKRTVLWGKEERYHLKLKKYKCQLKNPSLFHLRFLSLNWFDFL